MQIILSIKPKYCEEIFSGTKRFEYRRRVFKQEIQKVFVYATSPVCKIVGEFELERIIADTPDSIWNQTTNMEVSLGNFMISISMVRIWLMHWQ